MLDPSMELFMSEKPTHLGAESCGMLRFNQLHAAETCYPELIAVPQVYHLGHLHWEKFKMGLDFGFAGGGHADGDAEWRYVSESWFQQPCLCLRFCSVQLSVKICSKRNTRFLWFCRRTFDIAELVSASAKFAYFCTDVLTTWGSTTRFWALAQKLRSGNMQCVCCARWLPNRCRQLWSATMLPLGLGGGT
jgi:hypothetical protein